jgi:hypothetical protein
VSAGPLVNTRETKLVPPRVNFLNLPPLPRLPPPGGPPGAIM